jgi:hypothetical protein
VGSYLRKCAAPLRSKTDTVGTATAGTRDTRRQRATPRGSAGSPLGGSTPASHEERCRDRPDQFQ